MTTQTSNTVKTGSQTLIAKQHVAGSADVIVGTPVDVSTGFDGIITVKFGRRSASAAGASCQIRLEASTRASGDGPECWAPFAVFDTDFAACEAEAVSSTASSGQKVLPVASTTNLASGDVIFIANSTASSSEWQRIFKISTNASVTVEENLAAAQTSSTIYDAAEIYNCARIPSGAMRVRAVVDGSRFTQNFAVMVEMSTVDDITTVSA